MQNLYFQNGQCIDSQCIIILCNSYRGVCICNCASKPFHIALVKLVSTVVCLLQTQHKVQCTYTAMLTVMKMFYTGMHIQHDNNLWCLYTCTHIHGEYICRVLFIKFMIITLHGYTHPVNMMHAPVYMNSNPVTMPQLSLIATTESHHHN